MKHEVKRIHFAVSCDSGVDTTGKDFGFVYVSRFWEVATSQLPKIGRLWKAKRADLFNSGLGIGEGTLPTAAADWIEHEA